MRSLKKWKRQSLNWRKNTKNCVSCTWRMWRIQIVTCYVKSFKTSWNKWILVSRNISEWRSRMKRSRSSRTDRSRRQWKWRTLRQLIIWKSILRWKNVKKTGSKISKPNRSLLIWLRNLLWRLKLNLKINTLNWFKLIHYIKFQV